MSSQEPRRRYLTARKSFKPKLCHSRPHRQPHTGKRIISKHGLLLSVLHILFTSFYQLISSFFLKLSSSSFPLKSKQFTVALGWSLGKTWQFYHAEVTRRLSSACLSSTQDIPQVLPSRGYFCDTNFTTNFSSAVEYIHDVTLNTFYTQKTLKIIVDKNPYLKEKSFSLSSSPHTAVAIVAIR